MVVVVLRIKYICSQFLSCLWSNQSEFMALFMVFNLLNGPGFVSVAVNFLFFNSHFPVTTLGLDLFSGAHLLPFLWCPVNENSSV